MQVALYARVSTGRQAEKGLSIPDQIKSMKDWCESQGHIVVSEYIDAGVSATTEDRPQFQHMMADARLNPRPFDIVLVHSLSRFFREHVYLGLYEQKLTKLGIELISITQLTTDDPSGGMMRGIFALFDEHQSKENAKHTLRAMQENARQGYWNGSRPPFGYKTEEVNAEGRHGKKKKLVIDPAEAEIARKVFELYLSGDNGNGMSLMQVAKSLNDQGYQRRNAKWTKCTIGNLLANTVYKGEHWFNKTSNKTRKLKPRDQWIKLEVPAIISDATFSSARARCDSRTPSSAPPRRTGSPTLLTGVIQCGHCRSAMTLATGKGGKYRYYKCTNRINQGPGACESQNIRMEKLDQAVLGVLAEEVCQPERIEFMLTELKDGLKASHADQASRIPSLEKAMRDIDIRQQRLFDALETGYMKADEVFEKRMASLDKRRQQLIVDLAGIRRRGELPVHKITPKVVRHFSEVLRQRLSDSASSFAKGYVNALIDEVRVTGKEIYLRGSNAKMASALLSGGSKTGHHAVPSFGGSWLPEQDSNLRQID